MSPTRLAPRASLAGQADVRGVGRRGKELTENVNPMAGNLTGQVRNIADVTTVAANGDPLQKDHRMRARNPGAKETVNLMVDQLNGLASEVTRSRVRWVRRQLGG